MRRAHAVRLDEKGISTRRALGGVRARTARAADQASGGRWLRWATVVWSAGVAALVIADVDSPLRPYVVVPFLVVFPGAALVRHLRIQDAFANVTLAVALSFTVGGLVSAAMLYAGLWSPAGALGVLVAITLVATLLDVAPLHRRTGEGRAAAPPRGPASVEDDSGLGAYEGTTAKDVARRGRWVR